MIINVDVTVSGQGLHEITAQISQAVNKAGIYEGLCTLYIQHTSASLLIQENADPSAKADLECWLNRLVPESDSLYTHIHEGADDMPAHIKAALTATSISIPVSGQQLLLGTWQGIYLWEHRHGQHRRCVIVQLLSG